MLRSRYMHRSRHMLVLLAVCAVAPAAYGQGRIIAKFGDYSLDPTVTVGPNAPGYPPLAIYGPTAFTASSLYDPQDGNGVFLGFNIGRSVLRADAQVVIRLKVRDNRPTSQELADQGFDLSGAEAFHIELFTTDNPAPSGDYEFFNSLDIPATTLLDHNYVDINFGTVGFTGTRAVTGLQFTGGNYPVDVEIDKLFTIEPTIAQTTYTWARTRSGSANDPASWTPPPGQPAAAPNGVNLSVVFGDNNTGFTTVYTDDPLTLGRITFDSPNTYNLTGTSLSLDNTPDPAELIAKNGTHKINLPTSIPGALSVNTDASTEIIFANPVTLANGAVLTKNGAGTLTFLSTVRVNSTSGTATIKVNTGGPVNFDAGNNDPRLNLVIDPATVNVGGNQVLGTLKLDAGGNTLNVGRTSSGQFFPVSVNVSSLTVTGGNGGADTVNVTTASSSVNVSGNLSVSTGATLTKQGPGSVSASTSSLSGSYVNSAGVSSLGVVSGSGSISVEGGTVYANNIRGTSLSVASGGSAQLLFAAPSGAVSELSALTVAQGGSLDLSNNAVVVRNGNLSALAGSIASWLQGGAGISSSLASGSNYLTVAAFQNAFEGYAYFPSYGGVNNLTPSDVLLRVTYVGDTDLNGVLNGEDYKRIMEGFITGQTGWYWGDLDYNGVIDSQDVNRFLNAYNASLPGLGNPSEYVGGLNVIPEPGALAGLLAPVMTLSSRRRRSHSRR